MLLSQILNTLKPKITLKKFNSVLSQFIQNIDGGDGDYVISLLSQDKYLVFVEFKANKLIGSTSKKIN
jgi:hypothetical protein